MNTNTESKAKDQAQAKEEATTKLGLDVHAAQITVCRQQEGLPPQPAQKMSWERCLAWIGQQATLGGKVYSCYEAGPCGYGLHRQLEAMGVTNYVVAPQRWDERGRRVKNDKRDARELVDRLDRYVRGNTKVFAVVRVPTAQQEAARSLARQRGAVLKERTRCVVRGRAMLLAQGFRAPEQWWKPQCWLEYRKQLPDWLRTQVELWQAKALSFTKDLDRLDEQVQKLSAGKAIPKGLGTLTNSLLESEILDWHRFKNRREVASYTGLCPSENSSGEKHRQGSINKHGNPRVRHQLVEAAWRLLSWQPDYPALKKLKEAGGKRMRKKAVVAVARRLAVDLWRIKTGRCSAQKLGLTLVDSSQS